MCREILKSARKDKKMTQQDVAAYLEISDRMYKYIESGHTVGRVELWDKLEDLFNIHQRVLRTLVGDGCAQASSR